MPTSAETVRPREEAELPKSEALELYRRMFLIRQAEEKIQTEYFKDQMKTPVHLGIGEEAIPVGVWHCLPPGSKAFGTYRSHALYLAATGDLTRFFAELYGRVTGPGKGKAGSMHLADPQKGLIATSAVVGTTIPLAVGAALANSYRNQEGIAASFFGDGAMEEGVLWESLNFAALKRLPVLFVCEDNGLAIHTPASQRQGFRSIPEAVAAFHCHVGSGEGSDLNEVIRATRRVLRRMQEDPRPGFLHLTYFRFLEHVGPREDFDAGYRRKPTPEELERLDPIGRFRKEWIRFGRSVEDLDRVEASVKEEVDRAQERALAAPFASSEELMRDVWSG